MPPPAVARELPLPELPPPTCPLASSPPPLLLQAPAPAPAPEGRKDLNEALTRCVLTDEALARWAAGLGWGVQGCLPTSALPGPAPTRLAAVSTRRLPLLALPCSACPCCRHRSADYSGIKAACEPAVPAAERCEACPCALVGSLVDTLEGLGYEGAGWGCEVWGYGVCVEWNFGV